MSNNEADRLAEQISTGHGWIIKTLAHIVNCDRTDAQFDADVLPRDPIMADVMKLREAADAMMSGARALAALAKQQAPEATAEPAACPWHSRYMPDCRACKIAAQGTQKAEQQASQEAQAGGAAWIEEAMRLAELIARAHKAAGLRAGEPARRFKDEADGHRDSLRAHLATPPKAEATQAAAEGAAKQFAMLSGTMEAETPLERLRFYCSLAMNAQDWIDAEPFFDAIAPSPAQSPEQPAPTESQRAALQELADMHQEWGVYGAAEPMSDERARPIGAVPEGWKLVLVNEGFDELMERLARAHSKGYMPDAITEGYEGFDYRPQT